MPTVQGSRRGYGTTNNRPKPHRWSPPGITTFGPGWWNPSPPGILEPSRRWEYGSSVQITILCKKERTGQAAVWKGKGKIEAIKHRWATQIVSWSPSLFFFVICIRCDLPCSEILYRDYRSFTQSWGCFFRTFLAFVFDSPASCFAGFLSLLISRILAEKRIDPGASAG